MTFGPFNPIESLAAIVDDADVKVDFTVHIIWSDGDERDPATYRTAVGSLNFQTEDEGGATLSEGQYLLWKTDVSLWRIVGSVPVLQTGSVLKPGMVVNNLCVAGHFPARKVRIRDAGQEPLPLNIGSRYFLKPPTSVPAQARPLPT